MIYCKKASLEDLEAIWDRSIAENPGDERYLRWKESFIGPNIRCEAATYLIMDDQIPIGEVTLDYFAAGYGNHGSRHLLADGEKTAYVTALRIQDHYEGNGYISQLMRYMEADAKSIGFERLTIGVEAAEARTLAIYLHWDYNQFIMAEEDDGELVLFYAKKL